MVPQLPAPPAASALALRERAEARGVLCLQGCPPLRLWSHSYPRLQPRIQAVPQQQAHGAGSEPSC